MLNLMANHLVIEKAFLREKMMTKMLVCHLAV